ncbi:hypothetical protein MAC_01631 [Metarhizium acridum CQMa 102]|uniref:Uncharacterized protein n=1 Tax=Metarhizium acridum (strain CQMa 102) TaxID=655827 RepID=E9DVI3_METAQ|nr:uncharacterized protein MAC_01631 [Metarhizium acridum CQMa 102]EFY92360.1 hypothetical protein MAC_01631 [Metarhizium acridum CQMa 102]
MDSNAQQDSPLSTTSNIVGILTFVVAIAAAIYARLNYLRNSDEEYFRVKTSLSWYKTESTWLKVESKASTPRGPGNRDDRWTLVPSWQRSTPSVGMAWMSVRSKALELVRQREALTARVQFLQMSMISSRLSDLEARTKWGEFKAHENSRKMDGVVESRKDEYNRLETLVQQLLIHGRDAVRLDKPESDHESLRRKPPYIFSSTR